MKRKPEPPLILSSGPSWRSYGAQPLTAAEIDAHPDGDRIWATINDLRVEYQAGYDAGTEEAEAKAEEDVAEVKDKAAEAIEDTARDIAAMLRSLKEEIGTL